MLSHAIDLAELILAAELGDAGSSASAAARRALSATDAAAVRRLRVHPEDLRILAEEAGEGISEMALVADDTLARELHAAADQYGMSVLIEAHDEAELIRALGEDPYQYDERRLEAMISRLRRKISQTSGTECPLKAWRNKGYSFSARLHNSA